MKDSVIIGVVGIICLSIFGIVVAVVRPDLTAVLIGIPSGIAVLVGYFVPKALKKDG